MKLGTWLVGVTLLSLALRAMIDTEVRVNLLDWCFSNLNVLLNTWRSCYEADSDSVCVGPKILHSYCMQMTSMLLTQGPYFEQQGPYFDRPSWMV